MPFLFTSSARTHPRLGLITLLIAVPVLACASVALVPIASDQLAAQETAGQFGISGDRSELYPELIPPPIEVLVADVLAQETLLDPDQVEQINSAAVETETLYVKLYEASQPPSELADLQQLCDTDPRHVVNVEHKQLNLIVNYIFPDYDHVPCAVYLRMAGIRACESYFDYQIINEDGSEYHEFEPQYATEHDSGKGVIDGFGNYYPHAQQNSQGIWWLQGSYGAYQMSETTWNWAVAMAIQHSLWELPADPDAEEAEPEFFSPLEHLKDVSRADRTTENFHQDLVVFGFVAKRISEEHHDPWRPWKHGGDVSHWKCRGHVSEAGFFAWLMDPTDANLKLIPTQP